MTCEHAIAIFDKLAFVDERQEAGGIIASKLAAPGTYEVAFSSSGVDSTASVPWPQNGSRSSAGGERCVRYLASGDFGDGCLPTHNESSLTCDLPGPEQRGLNLGLRDPRGFCLQEPIVVEDENAGVRRYVTLRCAASRAHCRQAPRCWPSLCRAPWRMA